MDALQQAGLAGQAAPWAGGSPPRAAGFEVAWARHLDEVREHCFVTSS